uniref:NADH dehydrogenase [ubiquinone] 1 beta subcomplex subunit 9 n=1 Tax=Quercus lobata TaxID=97700 RepID=A0A7N2MZJ7_QUELO
MSLASTAGYAARRAAQRERVRILYRRALKDTLNWAVHRHLFYQDASELRERFEVHKHVLISLSGVNVPELLGDWFLVSREDPDTIDRMIEDGEAQYNKWRHPDPYIVPWAPGGSKFTRNPTPPSGIEIVYNFGREDHLEN